ncbi:MAG: alpha/beta hydrolase [Deltaproteobacteria bacterium]|nr:alpha/beta hydrolase [Deltaproteobacteria bacterium]
MSDLEPTVPPSIRPHGVALGLLLLVTTVGACAEPCDPPPEGTLGAPEAWEQDFLAGPGLPPPPSISFLEAEDGLPLAYTDWIPDPWDGTGPVVVLVPGSSAYGELYSVLGAGLAARGVLARVIDVRGHGRSTCPTTACDDPEGVRAYVDDGAYWPGRPGDALDEDQHTRDLHSFVVDLERRWPDATLLLAGHSSGAGLVARYVERIGMAHLVGAMQLTPFHHPDQPQNDLAQWDCGRASGTGYARVDLGALGDARRGNPHRYVLSLHKDPEYQTALDTLHYSFTTLQGMAASNPDTFHAAFSRPVLWIAGERDALLDLDESREEFQRLGTPGEFVVVRDTSHVGVSWSDRVAEVMAEFAFDPQRGGTERAIDPT